MKKDKANAKREKMASRIEELKLLLLDETDNENQKKLLDMLLSVKGQYDVVPSIYGIPTSEIMKEYDFGSVEFIKTKGHIIYHMRGGMTIIVTPRMKALYEYLDFMLSLKDKYDTLDDEGKNAYNMLFLGITTAFNLPTYIVSDDNFMSDIVVYILNRLDALLRDKMKEPLKEEEYEKNAAYENEVQMLQKMGEA